MSEIKLNENKIMLDNKEIKNKNELDIVNNARARLSKAETIEFYNNNKVEILEMIQNNISYKKIAEKFNLHQTNLFYVLNLPENQADKETALNIASHLEIENARNQLEDIEADDTNALVRKKTELSKFHIYMAQAKNPKQFNLNYKEQENSSNREIPEFKITLETNSQKITTIDNK